MSSFTFFAERPIEKYRRTDKALLVAILLLWGLGIFTLYICSPNTAYRLFKNKSYFIVHQLISSVVGFVGLVFFALLPMKKIRKLLPLIVTGSLLLCILTFIPGIGVESKGARRWIKIPFVSTFQPSEAVKFTVVLFLANLFDKQERLNDDSQKKIFPAILGLVLFVLIIFCQKDFSTGMFIFFVGIILFFVSGAKLSWLGPFALLAIPAAVLLISIEPYRISRVAAFINPENYTQTSGYQQFAAERAISSGGFWGSGFGSGLQKINSIPEVQADYIFAGWAESMGFMGVIAYFIVLCFFAWRAFYVSLSTPDRFAAYASFGCTLMIFLQSLLNCAVVCGAVPTTGIPLPFFSSGGSSIIFSLCMCGFILNASHCDASDDFDSDDNLIKNNMSGIESFNGLVVENE